MYAVKITFKHKHENVGNFVFDLMKIGVPMEKIWIIPVSIGHDIILAECDEEQLKIIEKKCNLDITCVSSEIPKRQP